MSTRQSRLDSKDTRKSPKTDNDETVDDMLANVDEFIEGVYRDLSISPPRRSSMGASTTTNIRSLGSDTSSPSSASSSAGTSSFQSSTTRNPRKDTPACSPIAQRNMDAEIDRINRICDTVDQNLRSIGLFMNGSTPINFAERISSANRADSTPTSSTSIIIVNNTSPVLPTMFRRIKIQSDSQSNGSCSNAAAESIVDLSDSQSQTPETFRRQVVRPNNDCDDDDDVILVSADIPSVVDLCTPGGYQATSRPTHVRNYGILNRRRLHQNNDEGDSCCAEPSSRRKRYSEPTSFENNSPPANETASATIANGRTPFMCPVCMDSCLQRQPTSTICGHVFCKVCIEQAITLTHKCPLCNKKISKKQTFRIYF